MNGSYGDVQKEILANTEVSQMRASNNMGCPSTSHHLLKDEEEAQELSA